MPLNRNFQGQTYQFPDGTTDEQIENYFTKLSEPKEKRGLLKDISRILCFVQHWAHSFLVKWGPCKIMFLDLCKEDEN